MVSQLTTAEAQHLLSTQLLGIATPPVNVGMLAKLANLVEANNRVHSIQESVLKSKDVKTFIKNKSYPFGGTTEFAEGYILGI